MQFPVSNENNIISEKQTSSNLTYLIKQLNHVKIIKKSLILFWILNMTI